MGKKLVVIGSNSPHVSRFINLVRENFDEVVYIGEATLETDLPIRQYLVNFRSFNPISIVRSSRRMREILERENPDVTHIQQINRVAYMAARHLVALGKVYYATAWGSDVLIAPHRNRFYKKASVFVLSHARVVTADSAHMVEAIKILSPGVNCRLVYFGIDPLIPGEKENIVYSNRSLKPLYNVQKIIEQFAAFYQTNPEWKLVIAGTGSEENSLRSLVSSLQLDKHVHFVGWLSNENNQAWYKKSRIYVSIPSSDGTSVSLLEAMSAGCIPVVSDLPVSKEWIQNGINGVIQKQGENGLITALKLDEQKVSQLNKDIIHSRATTAISAQKFSEIYTVNTHAESGQK